MYNIGPLESLRRITQRLSREGNYWLTRVTRLIPGARSRRPQMRDLDNFKGSPALLIVVGGCLLLCLCLAVVAAIAAVLVLLPQIGM
jgi:hypothetical protein